MNLAYEPYLQVIEKAVGCKPRVKDSAYSSKDWTLETECQNQEVVHGSQVMARLRIEPILGLLRQEGATELFLYIFSMTPSVFRRWYPKRRIHM